jgi:aminoglycoside phosphotransferase (APT) family kinase protein
MAATTISVLPDGGEDRAEAVREVCEETGLSGRGLRLLRGHATGVYLLPAEGVVARVVPWAARERAGRAVGLARWLHTRGVPVTRPIALTGQPVGRPPFAVTLWTYYPQPERVPAPPAGELGGLLRQLHALTERPPVALPRYQPLAELRSVLDSQDAAALAPADRRWLREAAEEAVEAYGRLDFPLGEGLVHGDAYPGNTLWDETRALLGDWDEAAVGPREVDLANTFQGVRFGRTRQELAEFTEAYGYDPAGWPGLEVLTRLRDLHTLSSFVRRAARGDEDARAQLARRTGSLRSGDRAASWVAS